MLMGGFSVGRFLGFRVRIDYSWFVVLALVTWTFSRWQFPLDLPGLSGPTYLAMGLSGALLLFLSVLLHELAHSVVARSRGIEVAGITLFIFGGVAEMRQEPRAPLDEFLLTIVGPLSSLALAAAFLGLAYLLPVTGSEAAGAVAGTLASLNLVLAVFNMVPAFPLDGGRVLRSILWKITGNASLATRWATWIGRAFGWLLMAFGFYLFMIGSQLAGVWGLLLGWFLTSAATSAARQDALKSSLAGITIGQLAPGPAEYVPAAATVEELVETYFLQRPAQACLVVDRGIPCGVVTVADASGLSLDQRAETAVREIMRPLQEVAAVDAGRPLIEVVLGIRSGRHDRLLVLRDGAIAGALAARDVSEWVERAAVRGGPEPQGDAA